MITSESITAITTALCEVQKEIPTLGKDRAGYGYKYLTLDNIIESVKPILCKHGIVIIQSVSEKENGIIINTRLQHISGEYFQDSFSLPKTEMKGVNNIQALGASITYGRRYSLSAMLNIATDEDTDGTVKSNQRESVSQEYQNISKMIKSANNESELNTIAEKIKVTKLSDSENQKLRSEWKNRKSQV